jgi:ribosome-binding factor A
MGDETQQQLTLRGLQNAAGFLQSKIANRIDTRHTPKLQFVIDKGVQNSLLVGEILERIKRENQEIAAARSGTDDSMESGENPDESSSFADSPASFADSSASEPDDDRATMDHSVKDD